MSFPSSPIDQQLYINNLGTSYTYVAADGKWIITAQEIQGYTGATGLTGSQGYTGATGLTGSQGYTGASIIGPQGYTGVMGPTGSQGDTGSVGIQGVTGLVGMTGSQGGTGLRGVTGISFIWEGPWVLDNPYQVNDVVSVNGNSYICIQNNNGDEDAQPGIGEHWTEFWQIMAAKGATGSHGITGSQGNTGIAGVNGVTGISGINGSTGSQGVTGIAGINGATGSQGTTGLAGTAGAAGATGSQGVTGAAAVGPSIQTARLSSNFSSGSNALQVTDIAFSAVANGIYGFDLNFHASAAIVAGFTGPAISSSHMSSNFNNEANAVTTLTNVANANKMDKAWGWIANNNSAGTYTLVVKQTGTVYANTNLFVYKLN